MCLASRALLVFVIAGSVPNVAWAQAPAIPDSQPSSSAAPPPPPVPSSGGATTPSAGQPFTPPPVPTFTPGASQPAPEGGAPASTAPPAVPASGGATAPSAPPSAAPVPGASWPPPAYGYAPQSYAQPGYGYAPPPPYGYAPAPPPVEKPPRDVRVASAHADRVVFMPTAETHPSGTWYLSDYDIILPQVGVAVSDRTQITLTLTGDPGARNPFGIADFTVKSVLVRGRRFRMAALGSTSGFLGFDQGFGFIGRAGVVTELCFEDTCRSSVNVSANMGFVGAIIILDGVGFVLRASELVSVLIEAQTLVAAGGGGVEEVHGIGSVAGVRFARERWGLDLALGAFARGGGEKAIPLPLIAFTYRFLP